MAASFIFDWNWLPAGLIFIVWNWSEVLQIENRVARFFLSQCTKAGKNMPNDYKITKCNKMYKIYS
jgi:hypothetical protein